MGMFDHVKIDKKFLPKEIQNIDLEWQTKSYKRILTTLVINEDGKLMEGFVVNNDFDEPTEPVFINYSGEIRFYTDIENVWWEFVALFEKGNLLKCIKVEEDTYGYNK